MGAKGIFHEMAVVLGDRCGVVGWNGSENFGKLLATGFAGFLFCGTTIAEFERAAGCESIAISRAAFANDGDEVGILVLRTHALGATRAARRGGSVPLLEGQAVATVAEVDGTVACVTAKRGKLATGALRRRSQAWTRDRS